LRDQTADYRYSRATSGRGHPYRAGPHRQLL